MKLANLTQNLRSYILGGDDFLRQTRHTKFTCAMLQSMRSGLDPNLLAREVLPKIESLERNVATVKQLWMAATTRVLVVTLLIIVARLMMLSPVSEEIWASWIVLDRICSGVCSLGLGVAVWWVGGAVSKAAWSHKKDANLGERFCEYAVLGGAGVGCEDLAASLREIRFAELRYGVDGVELRKYRFLQWFTGESDLIQGHLPRLEYIFIALDLGGFVFGGLGFVLVPFLAWIETASGT
jgi:hypothetical protein